MRIEEISLEHENAFLELIAEYEKDDPTRLKEIFPGVKEWNSASFKKLVASCEKERLDWRPKPNQISLTRYVMVDESGRMLATALLRFPLDEKTEIDGGNIVCDVPPSRRRQGHGSYCLALMLFEAVRAGLRRVLATCPAGDGAANRMIKANRGVLKDTVQSKTRSEKISRYWITFS